MKRKLLFTVIGVSLAVLLLLTKQTSQITNYRNRIIFLENVEALSSSDDPGIRQKECALKKNFFPDNKNSEYHLICDDKTGDRFYKCPTTPKQGFTYDPDSHCLIY